MVTLKPVTAHTPVLINEVLEYLAIGPGKTYLDVTFGSGGHTRAILEREPTSRVIAIDWDMKAIEEFGLPMQEEFGDRLTLLWGNFALLYRILKREGIKSVDGILADFGTSQIQIAHRAGFSVYRDTPLDMRMSPSHQKVTAAIVLNKASAATLQEIFSDFGQERYSKTIAQAIVQERQVKRFKTTGQLVDLIERVTPKQKGRRTIHPATRVFQALRIYVNHELDNITAFLKSAMTILPVGGRLVCISFHSLEDRLVKDFFKEQAKAENATVLTKQIVIAQAEELKRNPSARSAKLRALQVDNIHPNESDIE